MRFLFLLLPLFIFADTFSSDSYSTFGEVKYKNFRNFDYVNVEAKKGGIVSRGIVGNFDSFYDLKSNSNIFNSKLIFDTLMVRSLDEPHSAYGLIAKQIQIDTNHSFVIFHLDKNARFNDGSEVSAFDVEFSFKYFINNKYYADLYSDVSDVVVVDKYTIRFNLKNTSNNEVILSLGDLQIMPKNYYQNTNFAVDRFKLPLGSGPYVVDSFETGKYISYKRSGDYWAIDHKTRIGQFNFDKIIYRFYGSELESLNAFKRGEYDYRLETNIQAWNAGYKRSDIKREEILNLLPVDMQGFIFNTRKEIFKDIKLRETIANIFDFGVSNQKSSQNKTKRIDSYFMKSDFQSVGIPLSDELAILESFGDKLSNNVLKSSFSLSKAYDFKTIMKSLRDSGYNLKNGVLLDRSGNQVKFEILLNGNLFEKESKRLQDILKNIGIVVNITNVSSDEYQKRVENYSYDMIFGSLNIDSINSLKMYFGIDGEYNYFGIDSVVISDILDSIFMSQKYDDIVVFARALDRVLLWSYYVIPYYYIDSFMIAYKDGLSHPKITPNYGVGFETWWIDD